MQSVFSMFPDNKSLGTRYDIPKNAHLLPGEFIEVTEDGVLQKCWRCSPFFKKTPPLVAFSVMFKDSKNLCPSVLIWMEYSYDDLKFKPTKVLPISEIMISVVKKEKIIAISLGKGRFQKFQLYGPQKMRFSIWEALNALRKPVSKSKITEKLLNKFTFNSPYMTPEINGVEVKGLLDTNTEISLMNSTFFLQRWSENDLYTLSSNEPFIAQLRANNQLEVPCRGIFVANVTTGKQVLPRRIFAVTDAVSRDLVIGMNIIQDLYSELADPVYF